MASNVKDEITVNISELQPTFPTPKKKKKNKINEIVEDGAHFDSVKHDSSFIEDNNISIIESETSHAVSKKKKKKKENFEEGVEEVQVNHVGEESEDVGDKSINTSENVDIDVSSKKKKKRKKEGVEEMQVNHVGEESEDVGDKSSNTSENVDINVSSKKKKKKKKDHFEESFHESQIKVACEENMVVEDIESKVVEAENSGMSPTKKKKKKKIKFEESTDEAQINLICEENGPDENNDTSMIENEQCEVLPKKKRKNSFVETKDEGCDMNESIKLSSKKKKKRDSIENNKDDNIIANGLSADKTEDHNESESLEGSGKRKKKKRKNIDKEMEAETNVQTAVEAAEESAMQNMEELALPEVTEDFTVIDKVKKLKRSKVDRVLPDWLSNPTVVSMNLQDGVRARDMKGLDIRMLKVLRNMKIEKLFPIQTAVIPELLVSSLAMSMRYRPRDICVSAPTGSGKTLAYVVPIVMALKSRVVPRLRAVIILPTQELAIQVHKVFEMCIKRSKLRLCLAVGNQKFKKEQGVLIFQDATGTYSADILVATPGRLSDHISFTKGLTFKHLRFLVMDEVDLFLSSSGGSMMVKIEQLKKFLGRPVPDNSMICGGFQPKSSIHLPEPYLQQILLSATLMHDPEQLRILDLYRPKLFIAGNKVEKTDALQTFGAYMRPREIAEEYVIVDSTLKPLVLYHLITNYKLNRVLVFMKSTKGTSSLALLLSIMAKQYKIESFSSKAEKRKQIVRDFAAGKIDVLVCSDAMARGLDVNVAQVISYDVPSLQTYVHRIGRTGRAGEMGFALTLVEDTLEAKRDFHHILTSCKDRLTKIKVLEKALVQYEAMYQNALSSMKEKLSEIKQQQNLKRKTLLKERHKKLREKRKKLKEGNT